MGRPEKQYLCRICRETNSTKFYVSRKSLCKSCELSKIKKIKSPAQFENKLKKILSNQEAKLRENYDEQIDEINTYNEIVYNTLNSVIAKQNDIIAYLASKHT